MNRSSLSRHLRSEFLLALSWTHECVEPVTLRRLLKTLATEITPMRGRARIGDVRIKAQENGSLGVKMTARHIGLLSEGFLAPRTLRPPAKGVYEQRANQIQLAHTRCKGALPQCAA